MDTFSYVVLLGFTLGPVLAARVIIWIDPEWPANCTPFEGGKARQWRRDKDGYVPEPDPLAGVPGDEYLRAVHGRRADYMELEEMSQDEIIDMEKVDMEAVTGEEPEPARWLVTEQRLGKTRPVWSEQQWAKYKGKKIDTQL